MHIAYNLSESSNILTMKPLTKLISVLLMVGMVFPGLEARPSVMESSIANPSLLSVCDKRHALAVAGDNKVEMFGNLTANGGKYTTSSFTVKEAIVRLKCLKQGFIAVATTKRFCIVDPANTSDMKCRDIKDNPLSIAEQPESNMTYLLLASNSLELTEIQAVNYGASFNKTPLSLPQQSNVAFASYVGNRHYIYVADELNHFSLYRRPFSSSLVSTVHFDELGRAREVKGLGSISSALIVYENGNFVLMKEEEQVGTWADTPYEHGCLCTKERFALANRKKLAIFDLEEVKLYDGFTVEDLAAMACVSDGQMFSIYLLDGSGKVVVVQVGEGGGGFFLYLVIILAIVIVVLAVKFVWFPLRQHALSTDLDDASRQDRQNQYQQLRDLNVRDGIKETK